MTTTARKKPPLNFRSFISFLLTWTFLLIAFTGAILYFTPQGRMAHWTDWRMLSLTKDQWSALHINSCLLFLIGAALHIYLNWRVFFSYIRTRATAGFRRKWEFALASLLAVVFAGGTLAVLPPFSTIMQINENIKQYWSGQVTAKAPVPHAEALPLRKLVGYIEGAELQHVMKALRSAGYEVADASITLEMLAEQTGASPMEIYGEILQGMNGPERAD